ncbi:inositol 1,4,5-triphosphate receptor associated 2-like isoform X2 [Protopterus annectens]|uniref:inositol 1,4,5-triphosphate receptor associated 2-like isoform X2 n=1 Tax=Protopterus annectens TaxID=7888 RepID=UPI001CFB37A8|nr:inositol 1,4,5-triphosphate receptor associated 2-like isoform X2 [Protopterus annectens]
MQLWLRSSSDICCFNFFFFPQTAFVHLSLAFKCDMFTLQKRLQIEERSRDVAEDNIRLELQSCRSMVQKLKSFCLDVRRREAIQQLENSLEVLANATERLSHAAEILGAVHQEARVSRAVEIMLRHVENLKRHRIREHTELEEMKRLINHKPMSQQSAECQDGELRSRYQIMKSFHQAAAARRRVSIAVIPKPFMNFHMSDSKGSNSDRQSMESDLPKQVGENRQQDSRHPFYHLDDSLLENFAQDVDSFSSRHSLLTTDSSEQEGDILYSFNREVGGLRKPGEEPSLQLDRWTENIESEELEIQSKMSECLQTLLRGLLLLLPLSEHHWLLLQLTLLLLLCAVVIGVLVWQRCGQTSDS